MKTLVVPVVLFLKMRTLNSLLSSLAVMPTSFAFWIRNRWVRRTALPENSQLPMIPFTHGLMFAPNRFPRPTGTSVQKPPSRRPSLKLV